MQVHAKRDPLLECLLRLIRLVNISTLSTLHPSFFMIQLGVNHTISNRLGNDVLCILFAIQVQLEADVSQADS